MCALWLYKCVPGPTNRHVDYDALHALLRVGLLSSQNMLKWVGGCVCVCVCGWAVSCCGNNTNLLNYLRVDHSTERVCSSELKMTIKEVLLR